MSKSDLVRFSRDGDQFHYLWAARRCLRLLSPSSGLVAISIEGASANEAPLTGSIDAGEELIDVGEYYGSEDVSTATLVRYVQLKHSTQAPNEPWSASGLRKTISGFAKRWAALKQRVGERADRHIQFCFVSNRPISSDFKEAIDDLAKGIEDRHSKNVKKLEDFTSLSGSELAAFCRILRVEGEQEPYRRQRTSLAAEAKFYLPGDDVDGPIQLKELVTRKALSESSQNPSITKIDVLRALGTTEDHLYPAPSRLEELKAAVPRAQEEEIVTSIVQSKTPILIHAEGGVGKSILAQRIGLRLPAHSHAVVYDCFGNGEYRRAASPRHRHKDALVQIANELAAQGLCDPLIPSARADNADHLKAFLHRVRQCVQTLRANSAEAILCIAVDAADNAEMAAREFGEDRSFARDLIREEVPDGSRFVFLCRTERRDLLGVPSATVSLELRTFSREETAVFLRTRFSNASENDVDEFHRLTSQNPRVQATALSQNVPLPQILRSLGPNPTTVDDAIASILENAIALLRERAGESEFPKLDLLCFALATLRPLVPIDVLATVSGVDASAIRSFAADLGRPLLLTGNSVQFRDEPVESWFRKRFRAERDQIKQFIDRLRPQAATSGYVAATLPQLLLEAGELDELVSIALSSDALPENSPLEKQDIEVQRLQFAIKATLRSKNYVDAAKLSLKAAQEMAGHDRQLTLLQSNTDLAAAVLEPNRIQEIASRRTFGGGWLGAHHAYEAALLSYVPSFRGEARSRLRMAFEWLSNWSRLTEDEREKEEIADLDIAELNTAIMNIGGPEACAREIRGWIPRQVSFRIGRIIAQRCIDHGRYQILDQLAVAAGNNFLLVLAINYELRGVLRSASKATIERTLRLVLSKHVKVPLPHFDNDSHTLAAIVALVEAAQLYGLCDKSTLAALLNKHLPEAPPASLASRYLDDRGPLLRAYSLRAALNGLDLGIMDLAGPDLRKELSDGNRHSESRQARELKSVVGPLLPWHKLRATNLVQRQNHTDLQPAIAAARKGLESAARYDSSTGAGIANEAATVWLEILVTHQAVEQGKELGDWIRSLETPLYTTTLTKLSRVAARSEGFRQLAYDLTKVAFSVIKDAREDAASKADTCIDIARSLLSIDPSEASEYFSKAVEVASKFGDEVLDRWQALLDLGKRAAISGQPRPQEAYRFGRSAELLYEYVLRDKHFDWSGTVRTLTELCPASCLAILSRWRDRRFGDADRLLPAAIEHLLRLGRIDARAIIPLTAFRSDWDFAALLRAALPPLASSDERERVTAHLVHYAEFRHLALEEWRSIQSVAAENGIVSAALDRRVAIVERRRASKAYNDVRIGHVDDEPKSKDWDAIFASRDLHSTEGIAAAFAKFERSGSPFYRAQFGSELFRRITQGQEAACLGALATTQELDLYDLKEILGQVPETWRSRISIQRAMAECVKAILRRNCLDISNSRYYEAFPLEMAGKLSGLSHESMIDVVLSALGETTDLLSATRLFSLVGLLAAKLSEVEALDALQFGLSQFDEVLEDDDGDGPWCEMLRPSGDTSVALAGYVWARLAAPAAHLRWEAAHVVRGFSVFSCESVLTDLVGLAQAGGGGPYADARFHFYRFHAVQWLMMAFSRAALEDGKVIAPYIGAVLSFASTAQSHVLIQHFAAQTALNLLQEKHVDLDDQTVALLKSVNRSPFPRISSKQYQRVRHGTWREVDTRRFSFGYDMERYWFERFGELFAKTAAEVATSAESIIWDSWKLHENGHWDSDARGSRGVFRDMETHSSQGTFPAMDNLSFYLSYHALMTLAANWIRSEPLHRDPEDEVDEFDYWLRRHLTSRTDGRWLADRRDPVPERLRDSTDEALGVWPWSVTSSDLDAAIGMNDECLTIWGGWTEREGKHEQSTHIRSALVSPAQSAALLRALQTSDDSYGSHLPGSGSEQDIDGATFRLIGWIQHEERERGIEEFDPWSGSIVYPPARPDFATRDLLALESTDGDLRSWHREVDGIIQRVMSSSTWGTYREKDRDQSDSYEGDSGEQLQMSRLALHDLLQKTEMDLLVSVEISRNERGAKYTSYSEDGFSHVPYIKFFLLRNTGRLEGLRGDLDAWAEDRR